MRPDGVAEGTWAEDQAFTRALDRRAAERARIRVPVSLIIKSRFFSGLGMNISVGGIFVETEELHEVGTRVLVVTTLPTGEIQAPGVIGWVRRSNQSEAAGMGIAFEGLVSADGDAIKHFAGRTF